MMKGDSEQKLTPLLRKPLPTICEMCYIPLGP